MTPKARRKGATIINVVPSSKSRKFYKIKNSEIIMNFNSLFTLFLCKHLIKKNNNINNKQRYNNSNNKNQQQ